MSGIAWVHIGDLHLDEADDWQGLDRLATIVAQVNRHMGEADFVFVPGDNANHGTPEQYARMMDALAPLSLPWRIIPATMISSRATSPIMRLPSRRPTGPRWR